MQRSRTFVAFAELLQEWAEVPVDGPLFTSWGAALTYEMTFGIWRGCNVRVLSSDDALYPLLVTQRASATMWRNRTPEIAARARELAAGDDGLAPPLESREEATLERAVPTPAHDVRSLPPPEPTAPSAIPVSVQPEPEPEPEPDAAPAPAPSIESERPLAAAPADDAAAEVTLAARPPDE